MTWWTVINQQNINITILAFFPLFSVIVSMKWLRFFWEFFTLKLSVQRPLSSRSFSTNYFSSASCTQTCYISSFVCREGHTSSVSFTEMLWIKKSQSYHFTMPTTLFLFVYLVTYVVILRCAKTTHQHEARVRERWGKMSGGGGGWWKNNEKHHVMSCEIQKITYQTGDWKLLHLFGFTELWNLHTMRCMATFSSRRRAHFASLSHTKNQPQQHDKKRASTKPESSVKFSDLAHPASYVYALRNWHEQLKSAVSAVAFP